MQAPSNQINKYLPQLSLMLLVIGLMFTFTHPQRPLGDPGIGWQLKTGQLLVQTWTLPTHDPFSYTVPEQSWTLYQWLFQVGVGILQQIGGLPLVLVVCTFIYSLFPVILMQRMLERRAHFEAALIFSLITWMVMTMHDQTRPHIFSYLFFSLFLWALERAYHSAEPWLKNIRNLIFLPFLMILWCNMHGGFLTGLVLCAIFALASLLDFWQKRQLLDLHKAGIFLACTLACMVMTLVNPYGIELHRSILSYLNLESLKYWAEFITPFAGLSFNIILFEGCVFLLIILLAVGRTRLNWAELGCIIFFLHYAFLSVRHVNLFMLVLAPILARLSTDFLMEHFPNRTKRIVQIGQEQLQFKTNRFYIPLIALIWVSLVWILPDRFSKDLNGIILSKGAGDYIQQHPEKFKHIFNLDSLGGSLIYRFHPDIKVFMDDRTDLYRDEFILKTFVPIISTQGKWLEKLESFGVTSAILTKDTPLGAGLEIAGWEKVYHDEMNEIYFKK